MGEGERERGRVISLRDYIELEIQNHRKIYVRKKPMKKRKGGGSYSGSVQNGIFKASSSFERSLCLRS